MKVFTCTDFTGHYPVGTSAVVVATDEHAAVHVLEQALADAGIPQRIYACNFREVDMDEGNAIILCDGNY